MSYQAAFARAIDNWFRRKDRERLDRMAAEMFRMAMGEDRKPGPTAWPRGKERPLP